MVDPLTLNFQNIAGAAKDAGLARLLQGGSQTGRVLANLGGGRASVNIGGKVLQLNLGGARFSAGQNLVARLVGGQLQIALASSNTGALPLGSLSARSVSNMLGDFGLPASVTNAAVASALIAAGVPLSRDLILALAKAIGEMSGEQAGALAFLLGRGLPVSPELIAGTGHLLRQRFDVGSSLSKVIQGLRGLEEDLDELEEGVLPVGRRRQFQEHREELSQRRFAWPQPDESGEEEEAEPGERAAKRGEFAEKLEREEAGHRAGSEANIAAGKPPQDALLSGRLLLLHQDLLALDSELLRLGLEINLTNLLSLTQNAYESVSGERLANLPPKDPDTPPVYYFSVPFVAEGEEKVLEFLYRQHSQRKEDGGDLILRFDLSQIGPVRLQLGWREGFLTVGLRVTEAAIAEKVEPQLEKLKDALIGAGFRVAQVRVEAGHVPESLKEELQPLPGAPDDTHGLDLRV